MAILKDLSPIKYVCLTALLLAIGGCALFKEKEPPPKPYGNLDKTYVSALNFDESTLLIDFSVANPTQEVIKVTGLDYSVSVNGVEIAAEKQRRFGFISPNRMGHVRMPVKIEAIRLIALTKDLDKQGEISYTVTATARMEGKALGEFSIDAETGGKLPVTRKLTLTITDVAVNTIDTTSVTMTIGLDADNPNGFDITVPELTYKLVVDGSPWMESQTAKPELLPARKQSHLLIPVRLRFGSASIALYDALSTHQPMNYHLYGELVADSPLELLKHIKVPFDTSGTFQAH